MSFAYLAAEFNLATLCLGVLNRLLVHIYALLRMHGTVQDAI